MKTWISLAIILLFIGLAYFTYNSEDKPTVELSRSETTEHKNLNQTNFKELDAPFFKGNQSEDISKKAADHQFETPKEYEELLRCIENLDTESLLRQGDINPYVISINASREQTNKAISKGINEGIIDVPQAFSAIQRKSYLEAETAYKSDFSVNPSIFVNKDPAVQEELLNQMSNFGQTLEKSFADVLTFSQLVDPTILREGGQKIVIDGDAFVAQKLAIMSISDIRQLDVTLKSETLLRSIELGLDEDKLISIASITDIHDKPLLNGIGEINHLLDRAVLLNYPELAVSLVKVNPQKDSKLDIPAINRIASLAFSDQNQLDEYTVSTTIAALAKSGQKLLVSRDNNSGKVQILGSDTNINSSDIESIEQIGASINLVDKKSLLGMLEESNTGLASLNSEEAKPLSCDDIADRVQTLAPPYRLIKEAFAEKTFTAESFSDDIKQQGKESAILAAGLTVYNFKNPDVINEALINEAFEAITINSGTNLSLKRDLNPVEQGELYERLCKSDSVNGIFENMQLFKDVEPLAATWYQCSDHYENFEQEFFTSSETHASWLYYLVYSRNYYHPSILEIDRTTDISGGQHGTDALALLINQLSTSKRSANKNQRELLFALIENTSLTETHFEQLHRLFLHKHVLFAELLNNYPVVMESLSFKPAEYKL